MPSSPLVPILLALVAAVCFGAQAVFARASMRYLHPQAGATVTIVTAALVFWSLLVWQLEWAMWRSPAVWVFLSNGLAHPLISMSLSFEANRRMGATVSATIAATAPLFATAGAVLGLGETLSPEIFVGTLGTVTGIILLSWSKPGARSWPLLALAFPTGAAMVRAFNHVWGKFGLSLLAEPLLAATLSFSLSGALSIGLFRLRTGEFPHRLPRAGLVWATLSGIVSAIAILAMYTALTTGLVVVVSPVINTYPLFTLLVALAFRQERLSPRILAGVLLVVAGVMLISLR